MPPSSPLPRRRRTRVPLIAAAAAAPLVLTCLQVSADAAPVLPPAAPDAPTATHRVTLVTGDVVTVRTMVGGKQVAEVDRPADAVGGVRLQESGGDLYVVPDEAVGLLGADKLDRELFNVTDLIEMGYDDAGTGTVPMIATFTRAQTRAATEPSAPRGSRMVRELPVIRGAAITARKPQARTFWTTVAPAPVLTDPTPHLSAGVAKLWLDGRVEAALKESVPQIGAPEAWAKGYTGKGVTVAVLDTGIDADHPDLAGLVDGQASFVPGEDALTDINGHGTHVASTIVGTGAASDGDNRGVAPDADLLVGKVLGGPEGSGQDSWVLAGMEWAVDSGADVVSMSLGDTTPSDGNDPMSLAVDALSEQSGALFVIAAGNAGPESISAPGRLGLGADGRRGRQARRARVVLQHRSADRHRRAEARHLRARRGHHRRSLTGHAGRRVRDVPHHQRHLHGHPARLRCGRDPGPAAPGLDRPAAQGAADEQRQGPGRLVLAVRGRHRSPRRGGRGDDHRAQHRLRAPRQLRLAARGERQRRDQGPHLHQRRSAGRHARPGDRRHQRRLLARRLHGHRARRRQGGRPRDRRPDGCRLRAARRLRGRHRRRDGAAADADLAGPAQGGRALRPDRRAGRPRRAAGVRLGGAQHGG